MWPLCTAYSPIHGLFCKYKHLNSKRQHTVPSIKLEHHIQQGDFSLPRRPRHMFQNPSSVIPDPIGFRMPFQALLRKRELSFVEQLFLVVSDSRTLEKYVRRFAELQCSHTPSIVPSGIVIQRKADQFGCGLEPNLDIRRRDLGIRNRLEL